MAKHLPQRRTQGVVAEHLPHEFTDRTEPQSHLQLGKLLKGMLNHRGLAGLLQPMG